MATGSVPDEQAGGGRRVPPWEELPAAVAHALRPALPSLVDEMIAAIAQEVEAYAGPLEGPLGRTVRTGTELALARFLDLIETPGEQDPRGRRVSVELGAGEFRAGRTLDALLSAYRIGARLAWRRWAAAGEAAGITPHVLYRLGEAIFAYIDGLSAESAEGYAEAQSEAAGERERRRRQLITLLVREPPPDERALALAAEQAGWRVPARLAVIVTAEAHGDGLATRLGPDAIAGTLDGLATALVPDPDGPRQRTRIENALEGRPAALGPTVEPAAAARSLARARLAHRLMLEGRIAASGLLRTEDVLTGLVIHQDDGLAHDLALSVLAPLAALPEAAARRARETLRAWLDHRGRVEETAHALGVHPQTVRYRLAQLRELFGDALEDPERRLALSLALRAA